jgi:hypothetical protein
MPTAVMGEYDALPGLSQEAGVAEPRPLPGTGNGHNPARQGKTAHAYKGMVHAAKAMASTALVALTDARIPPAPPSDRRAIRACSSRTQVEVASSRGRSTTASTAAAANVKAARSA